MSTTTSNYKLIKPDQEEFYNVDIPNDNMDIIDTQIKEMSDNLVSHKADYTQHISYAAASGTNTYVAPISGISSLVEGLSVKIKFSNANTGAATLNINGLGAKAIQKSNGSVLSSGNIKAGQIVHLVYTDSVFQFLGEGGEYGTATTGEVLSGYTLGTEAGIVIGALTLTGDAVAANVLANKTFYNTNAKSKITGTIPSKAAQTYTPSTADQVISAAQYLSGVQTILGDSDLIAANILSGANIFGVAGSVVKGAVIKSIQSGVATSTGTYTITAVDLTKSILVFGQTINSTDLDNEHANGRFISSTQISFSSSNGSTGVKFAWYVIEFASGINVQNGTTNVTGGVNTPTNVPISAIDVAKSCILLSWRTMSSGGSAIDASAIGTFSSPTNLQLHTRGANSIGGTVSWFVVTFN